jgi:hypothetical protein
MHPSHSFRLAAQLLPDNDKIDVGEKTIHTQDKEVEEGCGITHVKKSITNGKHTLNRSSLTDIITRDPGIGKMCGERKEELNLGESRSLARRIIRRSLTLLRVLWSLVRMYTGSLTRIITFGRSRAFATMSTVATRCNKVSKITV